MGDDDDTWELKENLNCHNLIKEFEEGTDVFEVEEIKNKRVRNGKVSKRSSKHPVNDLRIFNRT